MLVRDVLESKGRRIISIDHEATVSEAIAKLVQNNIGSLPVVDQAGGWSASSASAMCCASSTTEVKDLAGCGSPR